MSNPFQWLLCTGMFNFINKLFTFWGDKLRTMENNKAIVYINNVVTRLLNCGLLNLFSWTINEGETGHEQGPNGLETLIADLMQRKFALKEGEDLAGDDMCQ